jgi:hypothetical protein
VRPFDVGRSFSVKIQPSIAPNGVPTPADKKINNGKNPDRDVINFRAHISRLSRDRELNES